MDLKKLDEIGMIFCILALLFLIVGILIVLISNLSIPMENIKITIDTSDKNISYYVLFGIVIFMLLFKRNN